jgi:hypothetical protein
VLPFDSPRPRRDRRRPSPAPEPLEGRQLLAYSALGASLPDLIVSGQAPPVAAYGGPLTVTVDVTNTGQASLVEPLALTPGAGSHADSAPTAVGVYLSRNPNRLTPGAFKLGEIATPAIRQGGTVTLTQTFVMPDQKPRNLPGDGGQLYVYFRADEHVQSIEMDRTNNVSRAPEPVEVAAALPELVAEALQVPAVMQPGDWIDPAIRIANLGTVPIGPQGPLIVQLVASTDLNYGPTDAILATFVIPDLAPLSTVPVSASYQTAIGEQRTIDEVNNELVINGPNVQLPPGPAKYYLGVVVDPLNSIRELSEVGRGAQPGLELARDVGPPIPGLPPATPVGDPASALNIFPIPPFGPIASPFQPPNALFGAQTAGTATAGSAGSVQALRLSAGPGATPGRGGGLGLPGQVGGADGRFSGRLRKPQG